MSHLRGFTMRISISVIKIVLLAILLAVQIQAPSMADETPAGSVYQKNWDTTGVRIDFKSWTHPAGVYYVGIAIPTAKMDFDLSTAFAGELFACNKKDADENGDGTVDAAASCTSLTALTADLTNLTIETTKRYYVLDVNTAESGSNVSLLTIHGSPMQASSNAGYQPVYHVENYGGKTLAAINAALAACDTWAQANDSKGTVMLPRGRTVIVVSGSNTSPLISLPEHVTATASQYNSSCDLEGWGSVKDYSGGGSIDPSGSSLVVWYPALMTATNGYKAVLFAPGHNQKLRNFNVVLTGDNGTHVDGSTVLLAASSTAGSRTFGANGIKRAIIDNVVFSSAWNGYGVGFASVFWLDNIMTSSWFQGFRYGWTPVTQASTANNANFIAGNAWKANNVGIYIDGGLACQDMYLHRNTLEANAYAIRMTSTASCRVSSYGNHYEQDLTGTQVGVNDILIEGTSGSFSSFGDFFDSNLNAGAHIVRTAAQAAGVSDDVVVGANFRDNTTQPYTYAAGAKIQIGNATSWARSRLPNGTTRPTDCEIGDQFMDTDATSGSRYFLCEAADTWVLQADGVGAASGGDPILIEGSAVVDASGVDFIADQGLVTTFDSGTSPDQSVLGFDYSLGYASALGAEKIAFSTAGTGSGGFVAEGQTNNTFEYLFSFPLMSEATADAEHFIVMETIAQTLANKTLASPAFSGTATGDNTIPSSLITTEVRSMWFGAAGLSVDGTHCVTPAEVTINSGPKLFTIICADNDAATIYGSTTMPDSWDGGTLTFEQVYIQTAADTGPLNGDIAAQCRGNGETPSSTWGTEIAIDDAAVVGSNANDHTTSAAVTPAGTCAAGDTLYWRYQLDATGTTTAAATLNTLGFKMEYASNVGD